MSKSEGRRRRRVHTPEFKAETVQLVLTGGRSIGQVARNLIDGFYNVQRRHSAIDYKSPIEFELIQSVKEAA